MRISERIVTAWYHGGGEPEGGGTVEGAGTHAGIPAMILILITFGLFSGCAPGPTMVGGAFEIEGTVKLESTLSTPEIPGRPVYVLEHCWWVKQRKSSWIPLTFEKQLDPSYDGKRVRVIGTVRAKAEGGATVEYFIKAYSVVILHSVSR